MPRLEKEIMIMNSQGLHARPAAQFVQISAKYESTIFVEKDGEKVNGKSIMGILMLGANHKSKVKVVVEGEDAEKLLVELENFLTKNE